MNESQIAKAVESVQKEVRAVAGALTSLSDSTAHVVKYLGSLVKPPPPKDPPPPEGIEPKSVTQDFDDEKPNVDDRKPKLILTLTFATGASPRDVEVVLDGVDPPYQPKRLKNVGPGSKDCYDWPLPKGWVEEKGPRFVTISVIDTAGSTTTDDDTTTLRRTLVARGPERDDDDDE